MRRSLFPALRVATALTITQLACAPGSPRPPDTLALLPYFRDLRWVQATTGPDTLRLLFDTGAGKTLLSPRMAQRLGCIPRGEDVGMRMNGERVVFPRCSSLALSFGTWQDTLDSYGIFDVAALLPRELPPLDGVLGLDAFSGTLVTLDWPNQRVLVEQEGRDDPPSLPTRVATGESGAFLSVFVRHGTVQSPAWLLLDSGNLRGTLLASSLRRDSLISADSSNRVQFQLGSRSWTSPVQFDTLVIDGALGTDFLMNGPVTVDLRRAAR